MADMQARMANQEEELQRLRWQVMTANSGNREPLAAVAAGTGSHWEALYERFRKQHPPVFVGGSDPLQAEQWMTMITSILAFMRVAGYDRVACAAYMLRDDARILWEMVCHYSDVGGVPSMVF